MATFKIYIREDHLRKDGLYPVSIRVCWKQKYGYIRTQYYVDSSQITKDFQLKDTFILKELFIRISKFQDMKSHKLGEDIHKYNARELAKYFETQEDYKNAEDIDFIECSLDKIRATKNKGTAGIYQTVINSIKKFMGGMEKLRATEINSKFLEKYLAWLKEEEFTPSGINLYLRTFRALFYAMRERYNDEEKGDIRIPHNPFKKFKIPATPITQKRALSIEQIRIIRDLPLKRKRDIMARDIFMLSFYLAGMNTADMYELASIKGKRLTYNRIKTQSRRQDQAFISILIEPEAKELIHKYRDRTGKKVFPFHRQYFESRAFNKAVNLGLKNVGKSDKINIDKLQFYSARHSWATIARNDCKISKTDIHEALNHSDPAMKITDIYIKKDWSVIDQANRKVLDAIK